MLLSIIGFVTWFIFLFTHLFILTPIIGIGFGLSFGTAMCDWIFKD
jgi:hypothetical protein